MTEAELKDRLKNFALRIIKLVDAMPQSISGRALSMQIVRSGTSPSANYRAACIAKSERDFLNKLKMVEEELDETAHWLELIADSGLLPKERLDDLRNENEQLLKIIVKSITSTRKHLSETTIDKM